MFQPRGVYTSEMTSFSPWEFQTLSAYGVATFLPIAGTQLGCPIIGYTNTLRYHHRQAHVTRRPLMSNKILDVVEALNARSKAGEHFFVTVLDTEDVGTFSEDNWHHLRSSCSVHDRLSFVIRRFEAERCPTNSKLPMKTVCGIIATRNSIELVPADAMERAMNTDAETGRPLPAQPDLRFAHARDVLPLVK